ncbi:MAG: tRNA pseudouridine(38-40) synthase TruA [Proteobacteria bacterium]|nr:tRNA pseudouridine(38-40) synthase TruA [Pseudomonadota bacterium]
MPDNSRDSSSVGSPDSSDDSSPDSSDGGRTIKLTLEYDGTEYVGWQVQKNGKSVQSAVSKAVSTLTGEEITVAGASRTDSGVHALAQCAAFVTESAIPAAGLMGGLNSLLPEDIVVTEAIEVPASFDPRRDSKGKVYRYLVLNRPYRSAMWRRKSWWVRRPLDIERMRRAVPFFIGRKDFTSFRATGSDAPHSVREITALEIIDRSDDTPGLIEFEVRGTAFLRHMVRIMAGTLVAVGAGSIEPEEVERIIEAKDRAAAPETAPGHGLCLVHIEY